MAFGLGNFLYDVAAKDGNAAFNFYDPEDADNTAQVSVSQADFPDGAGASSRQVADLAYKQAEKVLNDKRDARLRKENDAAFSNEQKEKTRQREEAADFHNNSEELANTTPTGVIAPKQDEDKAAPAGKPRHVPDRKPAAEGDKKKGK